MTENKTTSNTGGRNTGDYNTGYYNTGYRNTGYWNTGNHNTGNHNTGSCNTGYCNTGYWNTGNHNTGSRNTGDWNTGSRNTGYCNTITPDDCLIFNRPSSILAWENAVKPEWMYFHLTKWVYENDMSENEKTAYPNYKTNGGYLKIYTSYHHSAIESWENTTDEDRELTLSLPNFDDDVFKEIFGFSAVQSLKKRHSIVIDGVSTEISRDKLKKIKEIIEA